MIKGRISRLITESTPGQILVQPSQRMAMAKRAADEFGNANQVACECCSISERGCRHQAKSSSEKGLIANWLLGFTMTYEHRGFSLSFLLLRNLKGFS